MKFNDFEDIYGSAEQGDRESKEKGAGVAGVLPHFELLLLPVASAISFAIIEYIAPPAGLGFEWNSRNGTGNWHLAWVSGCLPSRSGKDGFLL